MFENCKTSDEIKSLFRKLAKLLHPDKGGDQELMRRLQESKDYFLMLIEKCNQESVSSKEKFDNNESDDDYSTVYEDVYDGDPALSIMDKIYIYAGDHQRFSTEFIDSVSEYLDEKGYVTSGQYNCLVKCYYAFRMFEN